MPTRILRDGIISSERVNALTVGAEVLYRRLISVVDDFGRFYGSPVTIRGACWPVNPEKVTQKEVAKWMRELTTGDRPLIRSYQVGTASYIQIENFGQQTRTKSRFPNPPWEEAPKHSGRVYFIQSETSNRIKIGFTELPPRTRLHGLQVGSAEKLRLLGSFSGTLSDERETQKRFTEQKIGGEWFECSQELLDFIGERCQPDDAQSPDVANENLEIAKPSRSRSRSRNAETETDAKLAPAEPQAGAVVISQPGWKRDETFEPFVQEFQQTGAAVIDEDFEEAHRWEWRKLDFDQKQQRILALREKIATGFWRDPQWIPKPRRFIASEWKRPAPAAPRSKVQQMLDQV